MEVGLVLLIMSLSASMWVPLVNPFMRMILRAETQHFFSSRTEGGPRCILVGRFFGGRLSEATYQLLSVLTLSGQAPNNVCAIGALGRTGSEGAQSIDTVAA